MNFDGRLPVDSTSGVRDQEGAGLRAVFDADAADRLVIGDGAWLLKAEFVRDGGDLVIVGEDGGRVVVRGYFQSEHPPLLVTPGGATMPPGLVGSNFL